MCQNGILILLGDVTLAGDRPPRYGILGVIVGRWENLSLARQRSRGTGPALRAFGRYRRARACLSPCCDRGGNPLGCACGIRGPPRYGLLENTVGRGPVPRQTTIAGDRPPRYGPLAVIVGRWDNLSLAMSRSRLSVLHRDREVSPTAVPRHTLAGACPPRYGPLNITVR